MGGKWILISSFVAAWGKVDPYFLSFALFTYFPGKSFWGSKMYSAFSCYVLFQSMELKVC